MLRKKQDENSLRNNIPWGIIYLLLIPLYALVYYVMPADYFNYDYLPNTFLSCLYYSAVTITTLGFGDIVPANNISSTVLASECVLGVIVIGLFLNSVSFSQSLRLSMHEQNKGEEKSYIYERNKTIQFHRVILVAISHYTHSVLTLLNSNFDKYEDVKSGIEVRNLTGIFKYAESFDHVCLPHSNIYYFFQYHQSLVRRIEELVREIDMVYWPEFDKLCSDFVYNSSSLFDYREYFLDVKPDSYLANKINESLIEYIEQEGDGSCNVENIHDEGADFIDIDGDPESADSGKIDFRPFIHLKNLLVYEAQFIEKYKEWIKIIEITPANEACNIEHIQ